MKKIRKVFAFLLAAALMTTGCSMEAPGGANSGASGASSENETPVFGIIVPDTTEENSKQTINLVGGQIEELGYKYVVGSLNGDSNNMSNVIENFAVSGVSCVLVTTTDLASANLAGELLAAEEIPCVMVGLETEKYDVFLTLDQVDYGYQLAKSACEWLNETYHGEPVEVAIQTWTSNLNVQERVDGFDKALEEFYPNAQVVARVEASTASEGLDAAENVLQSNPDVKLLLCCVDTCSVGAIEAFKGADMADEEHAIFGCDFNEQVGHELMSGTSVYRGSAYIDGTQINCGEIMEQIYLGEIESGTIVSYPYQMVNSENSKECMLALGYEVAE